VNIQREHFCADRKNSEAESVSEIDVEALIAIHTERQEPETCHAEQHSENSGFGEETKESVVCDLPDIVIIVSMHVERESPELSNADTK
jgi:hypothetical protein